MATTFYGPWYVVLGRVHFQFRQQRFRISGSDNADGIYPVTFGNTLVLPVLGAKWQIQMEGVPFAIASAGVPFEPSIVRESIKFVLGEGLIVQLDGAFQFEAPDPPTVVLTLICTSMDPEINPIPTANPFSFTLGERSPGGGDDYPGQDHPQGPHYAGSRASRELGNLGGVK